MSEQERSWRDRLTDVLMMRGGTPDPNIPPAEGDVFGPPMPDPWGLDQSARARRAVAADNRIAEGAGMPFDPRMRGWRR
jgi:hypothetical protein